MWQVGQAPKVGLRSGEVPPQLRYSGDVCGVRNGPEIPERSRKRKVLFLGDFTHPRTKAYHRPVTDRSSKVGLFFLIT